MFFSSYPCLQDILLRRFQKFVFVFNEQRQTKNFVSATNNPFNYVLSTFGLTYFKKKIFIFFYISEFARSEMSF